MLDVTTFLMRWMFLSNLLSNVADILTFPQQHPTHSQPPLPPSPPIHHHQPHYVPNQNPHSLHQNPTRHQHHTPRRSHSNDLRAHEHHWRNQCLQTILSYPPGNHRLLIVDAFRIELVQRLAHSLNLSQECLKRHRRALPQSHQRPSHPGTSTHMHTLDNGAHPNGETEEVDLDTDQGITETMQQSRLARTTPSEPTSTSDDTGSSDPLRPASADTNMSQEVGTDNHSNNNLNDLTQQDIADSSEQPTNATIQSPEHALVEDASISTVQIPGITPPLARERLKQVREYLPQLVSAVLKSPPAVDPTIANPIQLLRQLLLNRCSQDPSWGIELCWLLEADVGRAWKALFEHPQQTGRRLLVILPVDKAAVLAKIGLEKSDAFDLLQGAEQATAFGYNIPDQQHAESFAHAQSPCMMQHANVQLPSEPRLLSSLSQRRCAHFGDTMHFVDRLTKLSLDLRSVSPSERLQHLHEQLSEMNRRIRRRMVTKGEISLDMDDHHGPDDWPHVRDLKLDMLHHSVHFPLFPQTGTWPAASEKHDKVADTEETLDVVRVLNIVVSESRLLSSRERCPFLVQLEVADTGLEGHDARLYALGASKVGSTVEEALSMNAGHLQFPQDQSTSTVSLAPEQRPHSASYMIPDELMSTSVASPPSSHALRHEFPRGGSLSPDQTYPYQNDNGYQAHPHHNHHDEYNNYSEQYAQQTNPHYHSHHPDDYSHPEQVVYQDGETSSFAGFPHPSGDPRQNELRELHLQLQSRRQQQNQYHQQNTWHTHPYAMNQEPLQTQEHVSATRGKELLDTVFGIPWAERCTEIKESSPFGQVEGWRLASFIMKAGEDIRKESLVMQLISKMQKWFDDEIEHEMRPVMRPYTIMSVGGDAGLVECLSDAKSVDEVKKKTDHFESLRDFFIRAYGPPADERGQHGHTNTEPGEMTFEKAQDNFLRSLVGYSLVCYVLQIKDRHNANILLDRFGHVMHIDFGFVLGDTPKMGKVPIFSERAPFKLSAEFWDVLGGWDTNRGGLGVKFCKMFDKAFACVAQHAEEVCTVVELTMLGLNYDARTARIMANGVRSRLRMRGPQGSKKQQQFIVELVSAARASWGTTTYDWLQKNMNGYQ